MSTPALLTGLGRGRRRSAWQPGKPPGAFSAVATSGEVVTGRPGSGGRVLLVVVLDLPGTGAAVRGVPEQSPPRAGQRPRRRRRGDGAPLPYLDQLAEVALVCVEPTGGEIARAFEVNGFPAFFLLDADGVVAVSGYDPSTLPEPATV